MDTLSKITNAIIRSVLLETVEEKLQSKSYKIDVKCVSEGGENNFIGIIRRVSFCTKQNADESGWENAENLILKIAPQNTVCRYMFHTRHTEEVGAEHVRLVMQCLGKFHAISLAMNDQQPEKFKELTTDLPESYIRCDDQLSRKFCASSMQIVLDAISNEQDSKLRSKLMNVLERDAIDVAFECVNADGCAPTVISHGDLWQNNTMFRHDDDRKPIEVCFLDWQLSRHSSPIIDVVYYVFCCTTKELRDVYYDDFLKVYHESLSTHMRRLGSNPDGLFPYGVMMEHFNKFGKFGLFISAMLLPMITSEKGNRIDLDVLANRFENGSDNNETENIFITDRTRVKFNKRIRDVVIDMERLNYI